MEWWFRLCNLVEVYFVILILFFCILTIKKKQIWLPEAVTRIFSYFQRYISIIIKQSESLLEFHLIFVLFIWSCCRRSEKVLSILLKNSSCYSHSQTFFEEYYNKFCNSYLAKHHSFLVFFPLYCQFVAAT